MRFCKLLLLLLAIATFMIVSGCDLGTYESRFDEHFEGRLQIEAIKIYLG